MSATESAETYIRADRLKKALGWIDDRAIELPKPVTVGINATIWFQQVESLRRQEDELLEQGRFDASLETHRAIVAGIIAEGESLVWQARKFDISRFPSGFSLADLEAAIDSLRITFRCQHAPENSQAMNAEIDKLLNGS
jgi:hypothetical protein